MKNMKKIYTVETAWQFVSSLIIENDKSLYFYRGMEVTETELLNDLNNMEEIYKKEASKRKKYSDYKALYTEKPYIDTDEFVKYIKGNTLPASWRTIRGDDDLAKATQLVGVLTEENMLGYIKDNITPIEWGKLNGRTDLDKVLQLFSENNRYL